MKTLDTLKVLTVSVLILLFSSLTSKGQSESVNPDSQYRLVNILTLEFGNFDSKPISIYGDIAIMQSYSLNKEINGKIVNSPIFGINLKTGKFLFLENLNDLGHRISYSKNNPNVVLVISSDKTKIYKIVVEQDTITAKIVYFSPSQSITSVTEHLNEIVITETYNGITILKSDYSVRKFIPYSAEYSSVVEYGDLIVFGSYTHGLISTLNIETGEINDIRGWNTQTINGTFVSIVNNQLYVDVDGWLYKYEGQTNWTKVVSQEITQKSLAWNSMLGEYVLRTQVGIDVIFRNDSLIQIPVSPFLQHQYLESYVQKCKNIYGKVIGTNAWHTFSFNGEVYGVGDGMIGTYKKVLIPGEDTTTGFSKRIDLPKLSVYPNPTTDVINISNLEKDANIVITNTVGKIVLLVKTKDVIDVSSLQSGLYFVNVTGYSTSKFIKK